MTDQTTTPDPIDITTNQLHRKMATTATVWGAWWEDPDTPWNGDTLYSNLDDAMTGAASTYVEDEYPEDDGSSTDLPVPALQWRPFASGARWSLYDHGEDTEVRLQRTAVVAQWNQED